MRLCTAATRQPTATGGEVNAPVFDVMSLVHMAVGMGFAFLGVRLLPTAVIAVVWEVVEHLLKNCTPQVFVFPTQDTLANAVGDVLVTLLGWAAAAPIAARSSARAANRRVK